MRKLSVCVTSQAPLLRVGDVLVNGARCYFGFSLEQVSFCGGELRAMLPTLDAFRLQTGRSLFHLQLAAGPNAEENVA
jgi:hypothetical protein